MIAPLIETERIRLERLTLKFCTQDYVNWMNDPQVIRFLESGGDYTLEKLSDYLTQVEKNEILFWAIIIKSNNKHIGNIKIDPVSFKNLRGEYGIMMGDRAEWGKGYAAEASLAVIGFCFNDLHFRKISLGVVAENENAVYLYKKLGFVVEGVYKDHSVHNGRFYNTLRMALFNPSFYK